MKCSICGITVDAIDEAINNDWIPYFYEGDQAHEFACGGCSEIVTAFHVRYADNYSHDNTRLLIYITFFNLMPAMT